MKILTSFFKQIACVHDQFLKQPQRSPDRRAHCRFLDTVGKRCACQTAGNFRAGTEINAAACKKRCAIWPYWPNKSKCGTVIASANKLHRRRQALPACRRTTGKGWPVEGKPIGFPSTNKKTSKLAFLCLCLFRGYRRRIT